jgi:serine/threonine protein kinase
MLIQKVERDYQEKRRVKHIRQNGMKKKRYTCSHSGQRNRNLLKRTNFKYFPGGNFWNWGRQCAGERHLFKLWEEKSSPVHRALTMANADAVQSQRTATSTSEPQDWIINNTFKINSKDCLGSGSFGEIYRGINLVTKQEIAVKCEKGSLLSPQLGLEAKLYKAMSDGQGVSKFYYYGPSNGYNCLVMDLLGPSLEDLFSRCGRSFCLKTILQLADQLLHRIEFLHQKHFVHRDIKPDNFVIGRFSAEATVFMIDLGLCKRYRDGRTKEHVPYRDKKGITGTIRYVSINTHRGIEQSRRDDLESMAYMLIYFVTGSLPWQGVRAPTRKLKYLRIGELKMTTPLEELCRIMPEEFMTFMAYCRCFPLCSFFDSPSATLFFFLSLLLPSPRLRCRA